MYIGSSGSSSRKPVVVAQLNYAAPMDRRPYIVNSDYSLNDLSLETVDVPIFHAAPLAHRPRLDVEGLAAVAQEADCKSILESKDAANAYRDHMIPLMQELSGADEIIMAPPVVIRRQRASIVTDAEEGLPVDIVHSDFTKRGWEQARPTFYYPPLRSNVRRTAVYNMWKLLSPSRTNKPLALCDARSVSLDDVVPGDSRFPYFNDFSYEMAFLRRNSRHRWLYFPELTNKELLVFKQLDTDPDHPQFVPHTAFSDSSCPPDVEPRISVEVRCMACWYA